MENDIGTVTSVCSEYFIVRSKNPECEARPMNIIHWYKVPVDELKIGDTVSWSVHPAVGKIENFKVVKRRE